MVRHGLRLLVEFDVVVDDSEAGGGFGHREGRAGVDLRGGASAYEAEGEEFLYRGCHEVEGILFSDPDFPGDVGASSEVELHVYSGARRGKAGGGGEEAREPLE